MSTPSHSKVNVSVLIELQDLGFVGVACEILMCRSACKLLVVTFADEAYIWTLINLAMPGSH